MSSALSNLLQLRRSYKLYAIYKARGLEDVQDTLYEHNVHRCMHDVPLLEWDDLIAQRAKQTQHLVLNIRRQSSGCKVVNRVWKIWRLGGRR